MPKAPLRRKAGQIKARKKTTSQLKKQLDKVFSLYVRTRDRGMCITCGRVAEVKEVQAGHYVSRSHLSLRWDEKNVNCQCVGCNVFKHGSLDTYALRLREMYGDGILRELNAKKHQMKQWTPNELQELITIYEKKLSEMRQ